MTFSFVIWPLVHSMDVVPISGLPVLPHHPSACLLIQIVGPLYTICKKPLVSTFVTHRLLCARNKGVLTAVAGGLLLMTTVAGAAATAVFQLPVFQPSATYDWVLPFASCSFNFQSAWNCLSWRLTFLLHGLSWDVYVGFFFFFLGQMHITSCPTI